MSKSASLLLLMFFFFNLDDPGYTLFPRDTFWCSSCGSASEKAHRPELYCTLLSCCIPLFSAYMGIIQIKIPLNGS